MSGEQDRNIFQRQSGWAIASRWAQKDDEDDDTIALLKQMGERKTE